MKVAFLATVLALLIGTLLLSMWMRRPSYEGFETAPECTYTDEISNRYLLGCANNLEFPFLCEGYATLDEAKRACNLNPNCRGIVKSGGGTGPASVSYTIRTGGAGATDYTNLETMKRDMLGPSQSEATYLITNLPQCKPNTPASTVTTVDKTEGAKFRAPGGPGAMTPGGAMSSGSISPGMMGGAPEFVVSGESVTVPGNTLLAVPAGQTIFARRTGAGGATESTPAPALTNRVPATGSVSTPSSQAEFDALNLSAEERDLLSGVPFTLGLKIINAVRGNVPLEQALTAEELATLRGTPTATTNSTALLTTPSLALNSQTTGTLTSADLLAIQQAAAAGAAAVVNA